MRSLLNQFLTLYVTNDEFKRKAEGYQRALKSPDWEFLRDVIYIIRGEMANEFFSKRHTNLSKEEKDVVQRAYFNTDLILDFLINPVGWIQKRKGQINLGNKAK